MTVLSDSRYGALAAAAAAALGSSSPDVARAILSQWQCELGAGAPYPPPRNNPGNIARGLASELGLAYTVAPGSNPQPGNPIVTYPTASVGAQAYAAAIATHSRYAGALRAARAGDGLAFVRAIGSSGWGTGLSCMLSVYRGSGATGSGSTAPSGTLTDFSPTFAFPYRSLLVTILGSNTAVITAKSNTTWAIAAIETNSAALGKGFAGTGGNLPDALQAQWQARLEATARPYIGQPVSSAPDSLTVTGLATPQYTDPIADLFGNFKWVPGFTVSAGVLGLSAFLIVTGIRDALSE